MTTSRILRSRRSRSLRPVTEGRVRESTKRGRGERRRGVPGLRCRRLEPLWGGASARAAPQKLPRMGRKRRRRPRPRRRPRRTPPTRRPKRGGGTALALARSTIGPLRPMTRRPLSRRRSAEPRRRSRRPRWRKKPPPHPPARRLRRAVRGGARARHRARRAPAARHLRATAAAGARPRPRPPNPPPRPSTAVPRTAPRRAPPPC